MASTTSSTPINVGIAGYGASAQLFHIPFILSTPTLRLHSLLQRSPITLPLSLAPLQIQTHTTITSLLRTPCTLIVITTPPPTHFSLCHAALSAGKHVLVEKPFVPTSAEANTLISLAHQSNVLLCVFQNRRWDADFLTFQALQRAGTLGRIVSFASHYDRFRGPESAPDSWKTVLSMKDGGGVVFNLGTHLLDQMVVAFGMPGSVSAVFVNQLHGRLCVGDGEKLEAMTVVLYYEGGLVATAQAGVVSVMSEQLRFCVKGTEGTYLKYHMDVQGDQLWAGMKPGDAGFGVEGVERAGVLYTVGEAGGPEVKREVWENVAPLTYGKLYEEFAAAILAGDPSKVPVKAEEARDVLRIIEAARESVRTGGSRVDL